MTTPDLNTRIGKYFVAKQRGMNKTAASAAAGYPSPTHTTRIEQTKAYQAIEQIYYKDELTKHITLEQIAKEQTKNILQDADKSAKNKAIEMALSKLEPTEPQRDNDQGLIVVFK